MYYYVSMREKSIMKKEEEAILISEKVALRNMWNESDINEIINCGNVWKQWIENVIEMISKKKNINNEILNEEKYVKYIWNMKRMHEKAEAIMA